MVTVPGVQAWLGRSRQVARIRRPPRFLHVSGPLPSRERVVLWAHWDATGRFSAADQYQLAALRDAGYGVVVVTNRDHGADARLPATLAGVADVVLQRRNVGYDFGAWRSGLAWLRRRRRPSSSVLLMNNSMYGPFGSLTPLLQAADAGGADVWSATSSAEVVTHLQSWFLLFHPDALAVDALWRHWRALTPPVEKLDVVLTCEVPLAARLEAMGLRARAVVPYDDLARTAQRDLQRLGSDVDDPAYRFVSDALSEGRPLNPTHHLWRWLLPSDVPFVKKDLLRANPPGLPDVRRWREALPRGPLSELVAQDLHEQALQRGEPLSEG